MPSQLLPAAGLRTPRHSQALPGLMGLHTHIQAVPGTPWASHASMGLVGTPWASHASITLGKPRMPP
ncbi:hypothetical protein F5Y16DRAFT_398788 [Xylariaceae sp. FL0255]|nr:hypothetical protein F5Y16DRAFT_398788 [Xylariaceae sp. FL0255]